MSEAIRHSERLTEGSDLEAASLLCALSEGPVDVPKEDAEVLAQLEREGFVVDGKLTPLGNQTALVLKAKVLRESQRT